MGCQNTKVVAENVQAENKKHIMISYSWDSGQITGFVVLVTKFAKRPF